jgi:uncharacterized protein (DUF58 family)
MSRVTLRDGTRLLRDLDNELRLSAAFVGLAAIGWWLNSLPLAIVGALGALTCVALYVWQRECLTAVTYTRTLGAARVSFGEEVTLDIEIVNDKLLPVPWLHIEDSVPSGLELIGGTVTADRNSARLVHILPVLPYQRVRRRIVVLCRERGDHRFGPATIRSGDPIGLRIQSRTIRDQRHLLVYPKRFALDPVGIASRVLIGDIRVRQGWVEDPSRIAGVREYRAGDPVRSIDWRASARGTGLLVRQFEPTVTQRVALFADFRVPRGPRLALETSQTEFTIAVTASLLADLAERRIAVGLFAAGAVAAAPIDFAPSVAPSQLPGMLEALARCPAEGGASFPPVLSAQIGRLRQGTSVVIVASNYELLTLEALAEIRRRHAVTAVWVDGGRGAPPPREQVDALIHVEYTDDWRDNEILELAS